jgi:hypothetical protein
MGAEELHSDRPLVLHEIQVAVGFFRTPHQALARDELGDHEGGAMLAAETPEDRLGEPGHGSKPHAAIDVKGSDLEFHRSFIIP